MKYAYEVLGTGGGGQTWHTKGTVEMPPGNFPQACERALQDSFMKLTKGEAVFGFPGVGCDGPYHITKLTMVELLPPDESP